MEALGYEPNNLARNLRARSLRVFGLIVPDILASFFTAIARGVEDVAYANGFSVMLSNSDDDPAKEAEYLRTLRTERAAGVILGPTEKADREVRAVLRAGIPLVTIDRRVAGPGAGCSDHGQRRRGSCGGRAPARSRAPRDRVHRRSDRRQHRASARGGVFRGPGSARALNPLGVGRAFRLSGRGRPRGGAGDAGRSRAPARAVRGERDDDAGALRAVRERGIRMPHEIAVIGFDDMPWAPLLDPPLTAVAQPAYDLGRLAADALVRRLEDPTRPTSTVLLSPRLLVRGSCGEHRQNGALHGALQGDNDGVGRPCCPA